MWECGQKKIFPKVIKNAKRGEIVRFTPYLTYAALH
jgi:hypothetical protein